MQDEFEVKLTINNEMSIPGALMIDTIKNLILDFGLNGAMRHLETSEIFIVNIDGILGISLMPICDCKGCKKLIKKTKDVFRKHGMNDTAKRKIETILREENIRHDSEDES